MVAALAVSGRSNAGVDPAVQRLVALAHLLPFEPGKSAPVAPGHQLLGGQLLQPLTVDPVGQVDGAGGKPWPALMSSSVGRGRRRKR